MTSPGDYKMTSEEAFCFLRDVLEIRSAETKLKANKITFLDELIKAMGHHIPYQTITGISTPPGNRRLPTAADIKTDIVSKIGGLCYQLNVFCWMLLRALGFDVSLVPSDGLHKSNIHVAVVLNGLTKQGSRHLVEVGSGYPNFRLIPLDFEHVSPEYFDSFLRYRFISRGEGMIIFQHSVDTNPSAMSAAPAYRDFIEDGWLSFNFMHVDQPVSVSHFDRAMTDCLTVVSDLIFLTSFRCVAYPNGRLVCIKDSKLLLEDEEHRVQVFHLRSSDEIIEAFQRYFPQFPKNTIKAAMENVQLKFEKE